MADSLPKRKVSLTLDEELVAAFEQDGPLSTQVNDALRVAFEHRQHQVALDELIAALAQMYGPLDTPEDQEAIARFTELLS